MSSAERDAGNSASYDGGKNYFMYTPTTPFVFLHVCVCVCIRQIINRRGRSCSNYTSAPFIPPPTVCSGRVCRRMVAVAVAVVRLIFQRHAHATLNFRKFSLQIYLSYINRAIYMHRERGERLYVMYTRLRQTFPFPRFR